MGTTYRFIEEPNQPSEVVKWFRSLPQPPEEHAAPHGVVLYFREMGPLVHDDNGRLEFRKSPVANLFLPQIKRGVLWTVGELHFLATPLRQLFPELHKISRKFAGWLSSHECIFTHGNAGNPYDYYLEGSVRSFDCPIYAFESGLAAIRRERYFVAESDRDSLLDTVCRALTLRGVKCAEM
ncbi:hypothetical protein [Roseimicrobium sp. ORNL1]|uniref:hypothetical protein n=1 Tax=Roseimicrobium sp. ORNL1 TaxID=2711231 RepID=UPI00197F0052|nr:hypothetical protein [Roseimicrobium sp. ORNL1]